LPHGVAKPFVVVKFSYVGNHAGTQKRSKIMTSTKAKKAVSSTKNSPVTSPAITKAWSEIVEISTKGETATIAAVLGLARQMQKSTLSIRDIQKAIKATGLESPFVKVSHVEGLPTMLEMQSVAGFAELPLSKQLSTAVASYKLLGAGVGEKLPSREAIEKEVARERKEKHAKAGAPKETKTPKAPKDTLKSILAFMTALNLEELSENELDTIAEIHATIETKVGAMA
jgi:hypothetical protein